MRSNDLGTVIDAKEPCKTCESPTVWPSISLHLVGLHCERKSNNDERREEKEEVSGNGSQVCPEEVFRARSVVDLSSSGLR